MVNFQIGWGLILRFAKAFYVRSKILMQVIE